MHAYMEHASAALEMRAARGGGIPAGRKEAQNREGAMATKTIHLGETSKMGQNYILARYVRSKVKTRPNI